MFSSILTLTDGGVSITEEIICIVASMVCGLIIALCYMYKTHYTKSFVVSLIVLPALVQMVIMLVNGNLGASVAIVGAFSLIRYRSVPGTSKDLISVFFAMAVGLANGMGYVSYSFCITIIVALVLLVLYMIPFGEKRQEKQLKILIPENMDYTSVFDAEFEKYLASCELVKARTTDLGTLFELTYMIDMKAGTNEKEFIDAIRCKNGNLNVVISRPLPRAAEEL